MVGQRISKRNSHIASYLTMAIKLSQLPLPASANPSKFMDFGREVIGVNPGKLTPLEFQQVKDALYKVSLRSFDIRSPNFCGFSTMYYCSAMSLSLPKNSTLSPR
jgi:hypothetical protein